ncbi:hypothetical protein HK098_007965 [Nowakowskiella sp. JEL0407]|nr:hypothetical protein HK098_007965 [Nowakowskiella sp. JEL0407]
MSHEWNAEFEKFKQKEPQHFVDPQTELEFEKAFENAKKNITWEQEFQTANQTWADEFTASQASTVEITASDSKDAVQQSASVLVNVLNKSNNPKLLQSEFFGFMKQLKDKDLEIEGNNVIPASSSATSKTDWASEFSATAATGQRIIDGGENWQDEFAEKFGDAFDEKQWADEFFQREEIGKSDTNNWTNEYELFNPESRKQFGEDSDAWETLKEEWNRLGLSSPMRASDPRYEEYEFAQENPYMAEPLSFLENENTHSNLTESILALEAAVQKNPGNAKTWHMLGLRQQENENEPAAIAALRKAVEYNPTNLDSWLGLAVSYTNEGYKEDAYDSLVSWIENSEKYNIISKNGGGVGVDRHEYVTKMFLEAARMYPGEDLDENVQAALGVIFNISEEYEKAVDCFEAALSKRPKDYLLWNKLGATLANSNNTPKAIDAYYNALYINPSYVRARYNLAVACIQMNQYREAAEHLLGALNVHSSGEKTASGRIESGVASLSVWNTLRQIVGGHLNRPELVEACENRDLSAFKGEFEF